MNFSDVLFGCVILVVVITGLLLGASAIRDSKERRYCFEYDALRVTIDGIGPMCVRMQDAIRIPKELP